MQNEARYVAKYLRVSSEDAFQGESNSITNQRLLIDAHLRRIGLDADTGREFIDDGRSGVNLERPAFQNMMEEIRNGHIWAVAVKDFSRLGRDYIAVGNLMEQTFPFFGVRLISVTDRFDSENTGGQAGDANIALKNLANYFYSRDLSQKIKTANRTLMRQGRYSACDTIYGYRKDPDQKGKLLVDPDAARVIQRIYRLFLDGVSLCRIAVMLNTENVLTPALYKAKRTGRMPAIWDARHGKLQYWTNDKVRVILREERYTGTYLAGTRKVQTVGSRKTVPLLREQWIRIENHNEAIIPKEDFEKARGILEARRKFEKGGNHLLTGKLLCGICQKSMLRAGQRKKTPYVYCETPRFLKGADCSADTVSMGKIEAVAKNAMNALLKGYFEETAIKKTAEAVRSQIELCKAQIQKRNNQAQRLRRKARLLYENWKEARISEETFLQRKACVERDLQGAAQKAAFLEQTLEILELRKKRLQDCLGDGSKGILSAAPADKLLQALLSKILIYDGQHMEVVWNFRPPPDICGSGMDDSSDNEGTGGFPPVPSLCIEDRAVKQGADR